MSNTIMKDPQGIGTFHRQVIFQALRFAYPVKI